MIQEQGTAPGFYYDKDLKIEAYNLGGAVQKFLNLSMNITS